MRIAIKGALFILLMILLGACNAESNQTIFGKWNLVDNESESCPETIQLNDDQDHTFEISFSSGTILEGTYEELDKNDTYKLYYQEEELELQLFTKGDHLIISDADGHDPCEYDQ